MCLPLAQPDFLLFREGAPASDRLRPRHPEAFPEFQNARAEFSVSSKPGLGFQSPPPRPSTGAAGVVATAKVWGRGEEGVCGSPAHPPEAPPGNWGSGFSTWTLPQQSKPSGLGGVRLHRRGSLQTPPAVPVSTGVSLCPHVPRGAPGAVSEAWRHAGGPSPLRGALRGLRASVWPSPMWGPVSLEGDI